MRKWLFQHGLSVDQYIWSWPDPRSQTHSWIHRSSILPQVWKGNNRCLQNRGKSLQKFLDDTSALSTRIQVWAENRKQVLSTSFSSHSHVNRRPLYSAPAADSGWSCWEVPSGLQCSLVGWWSHSCCERLWETAKARMFSMLQPRVDNPSKT